MRRRWGTRLVVLLPLISVGCAPSGGGDLADPARSPLAPTFVSLTTTTTSATLASTSGDPRTGATQSTVPGTGDANGTTTSGPVTDRSAPPSAHVTDPAGDLTPSPTDAPPRWADLRGATLRRLGTEFELTIDVDGDVPTSATDPDHTMNIASFYDLDGDGRIDAEVWVNLADDGWGGAYYDNRAHKAAFARESQVLVRVERQRLVLRFPSAHLDAASAFRWSIASEWGRFETIGTDLAARDDAPEDDGAATFPQ